MGPYRSDIDGLRALAVFLVIGFHFNIEGFSFGFIGVDVFFVISGFLITGGVERALLKGNFSYFMFIQNRLKRLYPALLCMLLFSILFSLVFMLPYNLKTLGQSVVASIMFLNNILLYLTSGYWSSASAFKPLYHTWTLAVEWQFYLFFPLIISMLRAKVKIYVLVFTFIVSLTCFVVANRLNSEFAYLMLPSRWWELASGSLMYYFIKRDSFNDKAHHYTSVSVCGIFVVFIYGVYFGYIGSNPLSSNSTACTGLTGPIRSSSS